MKNSRHLNYLYAFVLIVSIGVSTGSAYWSNDKQIHYLLCRLSDNYIKRMGLTNDTALLEGSQNPDRLKGNLKLVGAIKKLLIHGNTDERVNKNFEAAGSAAERGDMQAMNVVVGSLFHYLQDRCDPTKEMRNTNYFRELAYELLDSRTRQASLTTVHAAQWRESLNGAQQDIVGHNYSVDQILDYLERVRKESALKLKKYDSLTNAKLSSSDRLLPQLLLIDCFAAIAAAQNRVVELLMIQESIKESQRQEATITMTCILDPEEIDRRLKKIQGLKQNELLKTSPISLTLRPDTGVAMLSPTKIEHFWRYEYRNAIQDWCETITTMEPQRGAFNVPNKHASGKMFVATKTRNKANPDLKLFGAPFWDGWNATQKPGADYWEVHLRGEGVNTWVCR
jgi:hypothetical protein